MSQPSSPVAGGPTAEQVFGNILQTMQQSLADMNSESLRRMEMLESGMRSQINTLATGLEALVKKPGVVDVKGIGKPEVL